MNGAALRAAISSRLRIDPAKVALVKLRYFAGLTVPQAAAALGVAPRTADFLWAYAKSWLLRRIEGPRRPYAPADRPAPEHSAPVARSGAGRRTALRRPGEGPAMTERDVFITALQQDDLDARRLADSQRR
jgi:ECF sigma factor